ncbi:hypothetical protein [Streptomyces sp. NPDC088746]|uniref:hypothetical protein n=1 Tax=Streptomyces sp. NPDC088746 TaxID=3365885 RepID=UPI0037F82B27
MVSSAPALLTELPPEATLRAWMDRYAAFLQVKRGMSAALRTGRASGSIATPAARERITAAVAESLDLVVDALRHSEGRNGLRSRAIAS